MTTRNLLQLFLSLWFVATAIYGGRILYRKWESHRVTKAEAAWVEHEHISGGKVPLGNFIDRYASCDNAPALHFLNTKRNREKTTVAGRTDPQIWSEFVKLYAQWPSGLRAFAERHVSHIYMVRDLNASGYVITPDDEHFTILIDEKVLRMRPNDWFTDRERTIFASEGTSFTLDHVLELEANNRPAYTLEAIIIHELAHCIGAQRGLTRTFRNRLLLQSDRDFYADAFEVSAIRFERAERHTELFGQLRYYTGTTQLSPSDYMGKVKALSASPFPTLYSTVNDLEYFADYFFAYMHCVVQQRPLTYNVKENGSTVLSAECGIHFPHHEKRRAMMDRLLTDLSGPTSPTEPVTE